MLYGTIKYIVQGKNALAYSGDQIFWNNYFVILFTIYFFNINTKAE
jgi:hypothetical protein